MDANAVRTATCWTCYTVRPLAVPGTGRFLVLHLDKTGPDGRTAVCPGWPDPSSSPAAAAPAAQPAPTAPQSGFCGACRAPAGWAGDIVPPHYEYQPVYLGYGPTWCHGGGTIAIN